MTRDKLLHSLTHEKAADLLARAVIAARKDYPFPGMDHADAARVVCHVTNWLRELATPCSCAAFTRAIAGAAVTSWPHGEREVWALQGPTDVIYEEGGEAEPYRAVPVRFCPFCGAPAREVNR